MLSWASSRLCLSQLNDGIDRRSVPLQDEDHSESPPHSFSGFPRLWKCSRDSSGVHPYMLVQENSSYLDRAPKMRYSVLLNSSASFLVTLPLISSKPSVIHSRLVLGTDVFRDWLFLGCSSCVSLVTAGNFRFFLNAAIFWRENAAQFWRMN